ncbi:MAG: alpha-2-macroglobulin family protein [Thermoguttaceae bacterium]
MRALTAILLLSAIMLVPLRAAASEKGGKWDAQWKKVDEAVQQGLPKTATERLQPILDGAIAEKNYPVAIKAIGRKIALEGTIQGNKPEEKITRLEAEIAKAPAPMQPMLEVIQADWYWQYFQHNRWRFLARAATAAAPGKDFTTWDLPRLFAEIEKHFRKALAAEEQLKQIPVQSFGDLLEKGTMPDSYRPTLYDFVAHQALEFYNSAEHAGARSDDSFELAADSPIFRPVEEFVAWKIENSDSDSTTVRAIRLYQQLLRFHENDDDKSALLDADIERLSFGNNKAMGEEKAGLYKLALRRFVKQWGDHPISAIARYRWAEVLRQEGSLAETHDLAQQGTQAFPNTPGGNLCYNLMKQIESKSASVTTERVWNEPSPSIRVSYRNVTKVYIRLVREDWVARLRNGQYRGESLDDARQKAILAKQPDLAWSANLPATEDFQERVDDLPVPKDLKPGFYYLLASYDPSFSTANNIVSYTDVWVSNLALIARQKFSDSRLGGFVLDAASGEPIEGAEVQVYAWDWSGHFAAGAKAETNRNGLFSVEGVAGRNNLLYVTHAGQELATANNLFPYANNYRQIPQKQVVFFTDRSLYRPGQAIYYKGIAVLVDQDGDNYKVLPNEQVSLVFSDVNNKEIARQTLGTNDYGSFSGSFTAPRDRLMGRMMIRADRLQGNTWVNVEEYKRPKFQATLDAPKTAARLGGEIQLEGKAVAYTGAAVAGAKVRYHVVRQVRYPDWWYWSFAWRSPQSGSQEITHGTTETQADGSFKIQFVAGPDLSVAEKDEPVFQYEISADVTDTDGETRSAERMVQAGYTALRALLSTSEWLTSGNPVEIALVTTTLDGEPQRAEGALKIYRLKQPEKVQRPDILGAKPVFRPLPRGTAMRDRRKTIQRSAPTPDATNPNTWELGELVAAQGLTTDATGHTTWSTKLDAGAYRAKFETQDRFGKKIVALLPMNVLAPEAKTFPIKIPNLVAGPKWSLKPGDEFMALWGSGYDRARAFVEVEHRGKLLQSFWTEPGATQQPVKQAVTEAMRGGFTLRVTMVRENRAYLEFRHVDVPWTNKDLTVKWEHFVSKLEPGQKETWTAVISGHDAKKAVAEMVATLYDQSLDAYLPHNWQSGFGVFRQDWSRMNQQFENMAKYLSQIPGGWPLDQRVAQITYRRLPSSITVDLWGYGYFGLSQGRTMLRGRAAPGAPMAAKGAELLGAFTADAAKPDGMMADRREEGAKVPAPATPPTAIGEQDKRAAAGGDYAGSGRAGPGPDLSQVAARKNLNETAFFFPHLLSDSEGKVKLEFTMPEALTKWEFLGFAHDAQLRGGLLTDEAVTAKDLMVQPNPPRFLREGDELEFTVKVTNQSVTRQSGTVRLSFANARTAKPINASLALRACGAGVSPATASGTAAPQDTDQSFDLAAKESRSFSWRLTIPDMAGGAISYKAVGSTGRISDGEEGLLPVLVRRTLVAESLPLPIRGPQTKEFRFERLLKSGQSKTLQSQSLTVQMVSNPAWYAVMALPYLMEYPYECYEQTFNRLYANALARHVASSDAKIHGVFEQWRGTPALDSPLEKNQDIKSVMLEETPWVRQAQSESQARRKVGILFDDNRLNDETARALSKLAEGQYQNGAWPWFPGGPPNDYITLYITTGFGRLRHLGAKLDMQSAFKSLARLDGWIDEIYREILRSGHKDVNHLSPTIALYLYGRSFFLEDRPIAPQAMEAVNYFLGQARKHWLSLADRQSQAHLAVALKRFSDKPAAQGIMRSIKERSVNDEELGMFWRDTELSFWWYRAPIETQAMMIEAFDEVMDDQKAVEECKVWLLKQKQTQDWKTTKATADAVYALLLRGSNALASNELVEVSLGGEVIQPENVEAGTGFYEEKFVRGEIKPELGIISVKKIDPGVAWGSVHWQYLDDMSKVTAYAGTPLKLTKTLYTRRYTKKGPVLEPVQGPVRVGDELVVRIVLRTDRDMEFIHLKDQRGAGTEPVDVLSHYKYQDGLGYYETTRDTASHFFIDYLPKGTYVFEYATRVVHRGKYQTGFAAIQCMYAPEFNSHSESIWIEAR